VAVLVKNFSADRKIALMGTIQFTNALHLASQTLTATFTNLHIPQAKPLSPGTLIFCFSVCRQ
jgi:2-(3-amino-3-carboxypropyl)histidine synthase